MLLSVNTSVHLDLKVMESDGILNAVMEWLFANREAVLSAIVQDLLLSAQEQWLAAQEELACTACGVVHDGSGWVRRGVRRRQVSTSSGRFAFSLIQLTCRDCGKTRALAEEVLGLESGQRFSRELQRRMIERVYDTSYRRSVQSVRECMGVRISPSSLHQFVQAHARRLVLRADPEADTILADGTKVRAGTRAKLEELRAAFQFLGRDTEGYRPEAHLRLLGLEVGPRSWPKVLAKNATTRLVVTDAEPALRAHVRDRYPKARHQQCEWHVTHTLDWPLREDGMPSPERKKWCAELRSILWSKQSHATKLRRYSSYLERLRPYPASHKQVREANPFILFEKPSKVRTTSLIERQMREVDRRALVGARWSTAGLRNLLSLSFAKKHNADDYAKLWSPL